MNTFKKRLSVAVGGVVSSVLLGSMLIAPAFAADPQLIYRDSSGEYTEVVAYNSNVATSPTEV